MNMRILVVIGTDFKGTIDYQAIADVTQEPFTVNQDAGSKEGWLFWDNDREPDWGWPDYTFTVGTVEVGRHEVTGRILATEDIQSYLINAHDRFSEEVSEGDESV